MSIDHKKMKQSVENSSNNCLGQSVPNQAKKQSFQGCIQRICDIRNKKIIAKNHTLQKDILTLKNLLLNQKRTNDF